MNEAEERVRAALKKELGAFVSPAKLKAATMAAIEAMRPEMEELREEADDSARERSRFFDALIWALGMSGDGFAERRDGQGAYWWRTELRRRAWPEGFPCAAQHWKDRLAGHAEPEWVRV